MRFFNHGKGNYCLFKKTHFLKRLASRKRVREKQKLISDICFNNRNEQEEGVERADRSTAASRIHSRACEYDSPADCNVLSGVSQCFLKSLYSTVIQIYKTQNFHLQES